MAIALTQNEEQVLNVLANTEKHYDNNGESGFSDVDLDEIVASTELNKASAKGVLGSLIKKGLVQTADVNGQYNIFYLTGTARKQLGMQSL